MKHTKGRLAARSKKASMPVKKRKAINLAELREEITEMVKSRAMSLVDTTIAEADKGHFAAMKYLFEMIGLYPAPTDEEEPVGESVLAKTLIRRLGLAEQLAQATGSTSEATGEIGTLPTIEANNPDAQANTVK